MIVEILNAFDKKPGLTSDVELARILRLVCNAELMPSSHYDLLLAAAKRPILADEHQRDTTKLVDLLHHNFLTNVIVNEDQSAYALTPVGQEIITIVETQRKYLHNVLNKRVGAARKAWEQAEQRDTPEVTAFIQNAIEKCALPDHVFQTMLRIHRSAGATAKENTDIERMLINLNYVNSSISKRTKITLTASGESLFANLIKTLSNEETKPAILKSIVNYKDVVGSVASTMSTVSNYAKMYGIDPLDGFALQLPPESCELLKMLNILDAGGCCTSFFNEVVTALQ